MSVRLCVYSCAIETTFPLPNLKTKHIYGIFMALLKFEDHLVLKRRPIFFLPPPRIFFFTARAVEGGCFASFIEIYNYTLFKDKIKHLKLLHTDDLKTSILRRNVNGYSFLMSASKINDRTLTPLY